MLKIYLARHGQDLDNVNGILNGQRDMPLSERGIEQVTEVVEKVIAAGMTFDKVYSSPLVRAFKTAEIITEALGIETPELVADLMERDFGDMTGTDINKIEEHYKGEILESEMVTYFLEPKGGETYEQLIVRSRRVLEMVKINHSDGRILLVTHGDTGKMLHAAYYQMDWREVLQLFHFGNSEILELSKESDPKQPHVFRVKQYNS